MSNMFGLCAPRDLSAIPDDLVVDREETVDTKGDDQQGPECRKPVARQQTRHRQVAAEEGDACVDELENSVAIHAEEEWETEGNADTSRLLYIET